MTQSPVMASDAHIIWEKLALQSQPALPSWRFREPLWKRAQEMGLPQMRHEGYVGTRLSTIHNFIAQLNPGKSLPVQSYEGVDIVVVDGRLVYQSSGLMLMSLKEPKAIAALVSQRYNQLAMQEKDPWALLNGACSQEAIFLRLSDNFKGTLKVQFLATSPQAMSFPRLTIWSGRGSQVEIDILSHGDIAHMSVELVDLVQEIDSDVCMTWQRRSGDQSLSMGFLRASLQARAKLQFCDLCCGSKISRLDAHVKLEQEMAVAKLYGLNLLQQQTQVQTCVLMEHIAPSCESSQLFKSCVKDYARSTFQGKIYVHHEAQKTAAYQLSRNLVLSPHAFAQSRPNLEIFADDVKASHGSATGEVDPESLFYLQARGIDRKTAYGLLVHGFSLEILQYANINRRSLWKSLIDGF